MQITIHAKEKTSKAKAFVHKKITNNLLIATPLFEKIGPIVTDRKGAAILRKETHEALENELKYLATRNKNLNVITEKDGAIYMGAMNEDVSTSTPQFQDGNYQK